MTTSSHNIPFQLYLLTLNLLQIMSSAAAPSKVKREQDGDEVVVDPLLPHRNNGNNGNNHPMTPPDHQNDFIMKVRTEQHPVKLLCTYLHDDVVLVIRRCRGLIITVVAVFPPVEEGVDHIVPQYPIKTVQSLPIFFR